MARVFEAIVAKLKHRLILSVSHLHWLWEVHGPRRHTYSWMCVAFFSGIIFIRCVFCYPPSKGIVVEEHSTLLSGPQANTSLSYQTLEDYFFREVERIHIRCDIVERIGSYFDGGWDVCLAKFYKPARNCLVYSFGIEYNFAFDEQIARRFGCTVRSFDPSMGVKSHVHLPGPVHFYDYGLAGTNTAWEGKFQRHPNDFDKITEARWEVRTLDRLMDILHDKGRTIDILKIDIEYSEWAALSQMIASGTLKLVKILMFEIHTKEIVKIVTGKADYIRYLDILRGIEQAGFRKYKSHLNKLGLYPIQTVRKEADIQDSFLSSLFSYKSCCYELYYVNLQFSL